MRRNSDDVVCLIAVKGTEFVGMAWLMMFGRVPNPDDLNRRSGDVQSVFVIPEHQGTGLGRQLMQALCEEADRRGVQKLTVNANDAAVGFYTRLGFASSTLFLQRDCQQSASAR